MDSMETLKKDTSKPISARLEKRIKWWKEKKLKQEEYEANYNDNTYYNNNNINEKKIKKKTDNINTKVEKSEITKNESIFKSEWDISDTENQNIEDKLKPTETDVNTTDNNNISNKKNKKKKKKQKREKVESEAEEDCITENKTNETIETTSNSTKKQKKNTSETNISTEANSNINNNTPNNNQTKKKKKLQYVVFVGKLAKEATREHVSKHFAKCGGVNAVRMLTSKDTGESRRCAYVEFADKHSHMAGLRLHNSSMMGSKINVEFTSVGRNTFHRMERLKQKNQMSAARFRGVGDYRKKKKEEE